MSTNPFDVDTKIYNAPNVGILRRIKRPDGVSFLTNVLLEQNVEASPRSVEVELQLTTHRGTLAVTMRRVARKPDSWHCSTSTIHLPPDAAADLAQSIKSLGEVAKGSAKSFELEPSGTREKSRRRPCDSPQI